MAVDDYLSELPDADQIRERLQFAYELWQPRNEFIRGVRKMIEGLNPIEAPKGTVYKIRTMHSYALAAVVNEKTARFTHLPLIQVVPEDEQGSSREKSSRLERAINQSFIEMERRSDGDVWARAAADAIVVDEGVERIERAPAAFWREVVVIGDDGNITLPMEEKLFGPSTVELKKRYGLPIHSTYVPLENFYPIYEGATLVESFETEVYPLRTVLSTKLFAGSKGLLEGITGNDTQNLKSQVTVVQYVNPIWHAYYAMSPGTAGDPVAPQMGWPNLNAADLQTVGQPILLYAYKHNLGQSIYNCIPGRFGGWKTIHNRIEGVNKGMLELNQNLDEVLSQVFTNVRAKYWPTLKQTIDPDLRGYSDSGTQGEPRPITIPEGQSLALFKGEDTSPLFEPVDDPAVPWIVDQIQMQMARLGGSPALYGQNSPGVETGYHQSLQITQAEHLDEKIEQHLSIGAARRAELILRHIKAMNLGEVYVHATEVKFNGNRQGTYHTIDPKDLTPLPRLDAQVRRPRPVDMAASLRTAIEATNEREGKGPLLSDDTVRESFLNITEPDVERHKILVEAQQNRLIASGVLDAKIAQGLNLLLAVENVPSVDNPADASPAALEATRQLASGGSGAPQPAPSEVPSNVTPGMPTGQSQPEQAAGNEISGAMFGNTVSAGIQ